MGMKRIIASIAAINAACAGSEPLDECEWPFNTAAPTESLPPSPSNVNEVLLIGRGPSGRIVSLYSDRRCSHFLGHVRVPDDSDRYELTVRVPDDAETEIYGHVSASCFGCSGPFIYREDSTPPWIGIEDVFPRSPASSNHPTILARAEPEATVSIYDDDHCGHEVGRAETPNDGAFSWTATVADRSRTSFTLNARDHVGNVSHCTLPVVYVHEL
jgi:hypothetical protein